MNRLAFSLKPFPAAENVPAVAIAGTIGRRAGMLSLDCAIRGDLAALAIPAAEGPPARKDRLWEETCLELFLGTTGCGAYWEFNLSPAGHWNVYRFTACRANRAEEAAYRVLPFEWRAEPGALRFAVELDTGEIVPARNAVDVGVCAVVRTVSGGTSHWALVHRGPQPDFHRRDGFAMTLPGEQGVARLEE